MKKLSQINSGDTIFAPISKGSAPALYTVDLITLTGQPQMYRIRLLDANGKFAYTSGAYGPGVVAWPEHLGQMDVPENAEDFAAEMARRAAK